MIFQFSEVNKGDVLIVVTHGGILHFICNILTRQRKDSSFINIKEINLFFL